MNQQLSQALAKAQQILEASYRTSSGMRAQDFCTLEHEIKNHGTVFCQKSQPQDLEISILLDRDYFSASLTGHHYSVIFEELSHFHLLSVNHLKSRQTSTLELEAQSEIDRLICTLSLGEADAMSIGEELRSKLFYLGYADPVREKARGLAAAFLQKLSSTHPHKWRPKDFEKLSGFFHADLAQKFYLARYF